MSSSDSRAGRSRREFASVLVLVDEEGWMEAFAALPPPVTLVDGSRLYTRVRIEFMNVPSVRDATCQDLLHTLVAEQKRTGGIFESKSVGRHQFVPTSMDDWLARDYELNVLQGLDSAKTPVDSLGVTR